VRQLSQLTHALVEQQELPMAAFFVVLTDSIVVKEIKVYN